MSLGVNFLFAVLRKAGAVFGLDYSVTIDETHHIHKKDAPSGTALLLGEKVADGWGKDFGEVMLHDEGGKLETPPADKITIRSHREGEVVGDHTVRLESAGETVEFTHRAWSRGAFATGALKAALWVVDKRPRLYDMQDVLGLQW
jgi:4-hydroxy-tetrahydrodipicolinate reductase